MHIFVFTTMKRLDINKQKCLLKNYVDIQQSKQELGWKAWFASNDGSCTVNYCYLSVQGALWWKMYTHNFKELYSDETHTCILIQNNKVPCIDLIFYKYI